MQKILFLYWIPVMLNYQEIKLKSLCQVLWHQNKVACKESKKLKGKKQTTKNSASEWTTTAMTLSTSATDLIQEMND